MYVVKVEDIEKRDFSSQDYEVYSLAIRFEDEKKDFRGDLIIDFQVPYSIVEFHELDRTDQGSAELIDPFYFIPCMVDPQNEERHLEDSEAYIYVFTHYAEEVRKWVDRARTAIFRYYVEGTPPSLYTSMNETEENHLKTIPLREEIAKTNNPGNIQSLLVSDLKGNKLTLTSNVLHISDKRKWEELNNIYSLIVEITDDQEMFMGFLNMEFHVLGHGMSDMDCDDSVEVYYSVPDGLQIKNDHHLMPQQALTYLLSNFGESLQAIEEKATESIESHYNGGTPLT